MSCVSNKRKKQMTSFEFGRIQTQWKEIPGIKQATRYWWVIIILAIFVYLVGIEIKSQSCNNRVCNNQTPPATENDSLRKNIDKTIETLRKQHTLVSWRRSLIIAFVVCIPIVLLLRSKFPNGEEFFVVGLIIFTIVYFGIVLFQTFWWRANNTKIEKSLIHFRNRDSIRFN